MPRPSASAWTTPPGIARLRTRTFLHGGCGAPHARHSRQGAISERAAFGRTPRARQYRRGPPAAATRDWHTQTHSTGLPGRLRPTLLRTSSRGLCPSRLHRRLLDEEPRGGAEITEQDVCGFDLENMRQLSASETSASPRLRDVIWRVFSRLHLLAIRTACRACRAEVADEGWTAAPHPAPQSATECNIETTFEITEMGGTAASPSAKARVAPRPPRRQRCPGAAPCNNLDVFSRLRKSDHARGGGEAGRPPLVDLQD